MATMSQLLGTFMGPMGTVIGMGDGRPDNTLTDMQSLTRAHAEARAKRLAAAQGGLGSPPASPVPPSALAPEWQKFKEQADKQAELKPAVPLGSPAANLPWWASGDMTKMFPGAGQPAPQATPAAQTAAPQSAPQVPMPQARPAEAPQAEPDTGFFMRNALSMRDPSTGEMIDPSGAQSVRGPDLISKMMTYLHNKA
jgi:hypothetical protein